MQEPASRHRHPTKNSDNHLPGAIRSSSLARRIPEFGSTAIPLDGDGHVFLNSRPLLAHSSNLPHCIEAAVLGGIVIQLEGLLRILARALASKGHLGDTGRGRLVQSLSDSFALHEASLLVELFGLCVVLFDAIAALVHMGQEERSGCVAGVHPRRNQRHGFVVILLTVGQRAAHLGIAHANLHHRPTFSGLGCRQHAGGSAVGRDRLQGDRHRLLLAVPLKADRHFLAGMVAVDQPVKVGDRSNGQSPDGKDRVVNPQPRFSRWAVFQRTAERHFAWFASQRATPIQG